MPTATAPAPSHRISGRAFLFAEIVSSRDNDPMLASGEPRIAAKSRLYRAHEACEAVLMVEQTRIELRAVPRVAGGWEEVVPSRADDDLVRPAFGLQCPLRDLYAGTHLHPRRSCRSAS